MTQILENLDLSDELKAELVESFDAAVLNEALKLSESKEAEYEEYMYAQLQETKLDLETKLDEYLNRVVEEFVQENTFTMDESVNKMAYETLLEGFSSILIAAGVEVAQIAEAKQETSNDAVLESAEEKVDSLMEEVLSLKATNAELLKTGLIKESMEDMTDVQKEKFMKLASVVDFDANAPESFINKLDTIAEATVTRKETKTVVERVETIVNESNTGTYVSKARHLY